MEDNTDFIKHIFPQKERFSSPNTTTKSGFNIGVLVSVVKKTDVNICAVA